MRGRCRWRDSARIALRGKGDVMRRALFATLLVVLLAWTSAPGTALARSESGTTQSSATVEAGLVERVRSGAVERVVVEFADDADLRAAGRTGDWRRRGQAVVDALTSTAGRSQGGARAAATSAGAVATSYWLTNVLVVEGADAALVDRLARRPEVTRVRAERVFPRVEPVKPTAVLAAAGTPEWGVAKIGAPQAWDAGALGQGVVVANIDTGVDYAHPALVRQYRGNLGGGTFSHAYSWWDPTGICGPVPCDNDGHGTHTMGTILGGDGPGAFLRDIGVAPEARWIAAKGCEDSSCSERALLSAGQFVLAPTDASGNNPDPSRRPDIVNNSWGGGPDDPFYAEVVEAWRAAGIIPVFSAGNEGPGCGTGGSPGDYAGAFSVGATDTADRIAPFSSRGPAADKVNPDVTAPGVNVVSSVPGGSYLPSSGTSMAAPHVAGALALVLSAQPALRGDVDGATHALRLSALDIPDTTCGGAPGGDPNNVYGDGRLDAAAAVTLVRSAGTLTGTITDADTAAPIAGAAVIAHDGNRPFRTTTRADGTYAMLLAAGTYTVTASGFGYASAVAPTVVVVTDETTQQDLALDALPRHRLSGTVRAAEDGSPLAGATVTPIGVPVAPVTTDAAGAYAFDLPLGTYTLRVAAGGCTDTATLEVEIVDAPVTRDIVLARKLDDFGHACRPIALDWVQAPFESSMVGDETLGRFSLPFSFPFYGEDYDRLWVSDNGYLTFVDPESPWWWPEAIPSRSLPNAAVYALWQDLMIDADAAVRYGTVGTAPDRAFVIQWDQVRAPGSTRRLDVEVKLWEDGTVDVLYGDNPTLADGRNAVIGIEDAAGTDALAFGFYEQVAAPNTAWRYEVVPTGVVSGTVTDANDGLPVAGATVTAEPGGRTATTAADGTYSLRLLPGTYELTVTAPHYTAAVSAGVTVTVDTVTPVDAALTAPVARLSPLDVSATVPFHTTQQRTLLLENPGSADLEWELRERELGAPLPALPALAATRRHADWGPSGIRGGPRAGTRQVEAAHLDVVIDDPAGDSLGPVDVTRVLGGADDVQLTVALEFSPTTPMDQVGGYVFLDVDQDASTGLPPEVLSGLPTQDVGAEYFVDVFDAAFSGEVLVFDEWFELVAIVPATVEGQRLSFDFSFEPLGGSRSVDIAMVLGDWDRPMDWAPDVGHGTITPFLDAPWMQLDPSTGVLPPGGSVPVTLTLGDPGMQPGSYRGQAVLLSNAPREQGLRTDIALEVPRPASFGGLTGNVVDARTFEPLPATITVHAAWQGAPVDLRVRAARDGTYTILAPAGRWAVDFAHDGHVTQTRMITINAGTTRSDVDAELVPLTPDAWLDPFGIELLVERDGTASATLQLGNAGPVPMAFRVGELEAGGGDEPFGAAAAGAAAAGPGVRLQPPADPNARTTEGASAGRAAAAVVRPQWAGDVLAAWPTDIFAWGVGYSGDVWIGDPDQRIDVRFSTEGDRLADFATPWAAEWGADMAWDPGRALLWQVNVGGDNGIYGLDPVTGAVEHTITGTPWGNTSQRGLAYDPDTDTFSIGGWNEGVIYRVAGPSWASPGATLSQCAAEDPSISGLAWNRSFGLLWMATNSEFDDLYLVDPVTCATQAWLPHPEGGGFVGAGLHLDEAGNLWTVSQGSGMAYLVESGLPEFTDVPWLSVSPTSGTVRPDGVRSLRVQVDMTDLPADDYEATVAVRTDDPLNGVLMAPVQVRVVDEVVTVRASRPRAGEPDIDGELTFTRSGGDGPLTVRYAVGGTATPGEDYVALPGTVRFADGVTSVRQRVRVLDDDEAEGDETITATIRPSADYLVGRPSTAVVTIADDDVAPVEETVRLSGPDRFATAVQISRHSFPEGGAGAVILARGDDYADALAGTPLAVERNAPMLLTTSTSLHPLTREELLRVLPRGGTVHLVGGEAALRPAVAQAVRDLGFRVERIAGPTRIETSIAIASALRDPGVVLVATGYNYPDALAAGAAAASMGGAVVLTTGETSHAATDAYLASQAERGRYAVGGPAARAYPSVSPIVGSDRVATSVAVARTFFPSPGAVGLARSDGFADALTGGAHIGRKAGPLLLTHTAALHSASAAYLAEHGEEIYGGYVYGGEAALSAAVLNALRATIG